MEQVFNVGTFFAATGMFALYHGSHPVMVSKDELALRSLCEQYNNLAFEFHERLDVQVLFI